MPRVLAISTAVWTAAFAVGYVAFVDHQSARQNGPGVAWWFVALLAAAAVAALVAPVTRAPRAVLAMTAVVLAGCALLGLLSVGPLLVPAVIMALLAAALPPPPLRSPPRPRRTPV